jgi:hypothetical protein
MLKIKKRYVINEQNEKVAVQLDLETFEEMERLLEDYALGQQMESVRQEPALDEEAAKQYYAKLKKRNGK